MRKVSVRDFGRDHWSLVGYIETLCVDSTKRGVGEIDKRRVRCNPKRHPLHAVNANFGVGGWKPGYGTRLSGFWNADKTTNPERQIKAHDDWDCLNDIEAAGFINILSEANGFVRMTRLGQTVAADLRRHKAAGGVFATFSISIPLETAKAK